MPKYSIITICLNDKKGLERTLSSIEKQIFKDFEWIVVDGRSTDGTVEMIRKNHLVDKFISEPDNGIYDAMNKGVKSSSGDYLLFLNSGDELYDEKTLFDTEKYLISDFIIGTQVVVKYKEGYEERVLKNYKKYKIDKKYIYQQTIPHQSTLIKREIFFKYGMYNDNFHIKGDHDFFARLIVNNVSFSFSPVCVSIYHLNGLSHKMKKKPILRRELNAIRRNNFNFIFRIKMNLFIMLKKIGIYFE